MAVQSYRDLEVWQLGMELARVVYRVTAAFPSDEKYGLTSQLRRSAVSIPSNIAEGHGRDSTRDYLRHLSITTGSLAEVETQAMLSADFGYLSKDDVNELLGRTDLLGKKLRTLKRSLNQRLDG